MSEIPPKNTLTKIDEFAPHWRDVNLALGALVLPGGYTVASLAADRATLVAHLTGLEASLNLWQGAQVDRDVRRAALKERMRQFSQLVRGAFPTSRYVRMIPKAPRLHAAPGAWMKAMADTHNVWSQIDAISPVPPGAPVPLVLPGGYTLEDFTADQHALHAAYTTLETTLSSVRTGIANRDAFFEGVYQRLKQYRLVVQGRLPKGAALLDTLPRLTRARGRRLSAVRVSARWDPSRQMAVIAYTASTHAALARYELRGSFGGRRYDEDAARVLDTREAHEVTPFETSAGLVASGSQVFYKVFVVLTTGAEKGSKAARVTRP